MIIIETTRLTIREVSETDFPPLLAIYTCRENMRYVSGGKYDWTEVELKEKYASLNRNYGKGYGVFAVEHREERKVIGEAGLFDSFDDPQTLELGYILDQAYWRRGLGYEICQALIRYAFEELQVTTVVARMYAGNTASVSLSEKAGMRRVETGQTGDGKLFYRYELVK